MLKSVSIPISLSIFYIYIYSLRYHSPNASSFYSFTAPSSTPNLNLNLNLDTPPLTPRCPNKPTNILANPGFEDARDMSGWTHVVGGDARRGMPSMIDSHTGDWAYFATGSSPNEPWSITLSQSVGVMPRRSYTVTLWSKQEGAGNCVGKVKWGEKDLIEFVPGEEWGMESVMFGVAEKSEGELAIGFECEGGGEGKGVLVDDVGMMIGWAP
jgi:hypothetical protein